MRGRDDRMWVVAKRKTGQYWKRSSKAAPKKPRRGSKAAPKKPQKKERRGSKAAPKKPQKKERRGSKAVPKKGSKAASKKATAFELDPAAVARVRRGLALPAARRAAARWRKRITPEGKIVHVLAEATDAVNAIQVPQYDVSKLGSGIEQLAALLQAQPNVIAAPQFAAPAPVAPQIGALQARPILDRGDYPFRCDAGGILNGAQCKDGKIPVALWPIGKGPTSEYGGAEDYITDSFDVCCKDAEELPLVFPGLKSVQQQEDSLFGHLPVDIEQLAEDLQQASRLAMRWVKQDMAPITQMLINVIQANGDTIRVISKSKRKRLEELVAQMMHVFQTISNEVTVINRMQYDYTQAVITGASTVIPGAMPSLPGMPRTEGSLLHYMKAEYYWRVSRVLSFLDTQVVGFDRYSLQKKYKKSGWISKNLILPSERMFLKAKAAVLTSNTDVILAFAMATVYSATVLNESKLSWWFGDSLLSWIEGIGVTSDDQLKYLIAAILQAVQSVLKSKSLQEEGQAALKQAVAGADMLQKAKENLENQVLGAAGTVINTAATATGHGPQAAAFAGLAGLVGTGLGKYADYQKTSAAAYGGAAKTVFDIAEDSTRDSWFILQALSRIPSLYLGKQAIDAFVNSQWTILQGIFDVGETLEYIVNPLNRVADVIKFWGILAGNNNTVLHEIITKIRKRLGGIESFEPILKRLEEPGGSTIIALCLAVLSLVGYMGYFFSSNSAAAAKRIDFTDADAEIQRWASMRPEGFFDLNGRSFLPKYNPRVIKGYLKENGSNMELKETLSMIDSSKETACTPNLEYKKKGSLC
jgi:hypothetical protein